MSWGAIAVLIILAGAVFEEIEKATDWFTCCISGICRFLLQII